MKHIILTSLSVAVLGLAGCAAGNKIVDDAASAVGSAADAVTSAPAKVTYKAPPPAPEVTSSGDANADLCLSKGGTIGEWPDVNAEGGATKNCRLADGSEYPLASVQLFEPFQ